MKLLHICESKCFIWQGVLWSTLCLARLRRVKHTKLWSILRLLPQNMKRRLSAAWSEALTGFIDHFFCKKNGRGGGSRRGAERQSAETKWRQPRKSEQSHFYQRKKWTVKSKSNGGKIYFQSLCLLFAGIAHWFTHKKMVGVVLIVRKMSLKLKMVAS